MALVNTYRKTGKTYQIRLDRKDGDPIWATVCSKGFVILTSQHWFGKWHARWSESAQTWYVQARVYGKAAKSHVQLHRLLMGIHDQSHKVVVVDHKNHNGLDNRFTNLRVVTRSANQFNPRALNALNTSGYRGVTWEKRRNKWQAQFQVTINGRRTCKFLGYFDDQLEAARVVAEAREKEMAQRTKTDSKVKDWL